MPNKALFLDRDGVINVDDGYIYRTEKIIFMEGIFDVCRSAKKLGYLLIVVTNQSGIGRGYYREDDFHILMNWMKEHFVSEGTALDDVYYCPHHPEGIAGYRLDCRDRKPNPGMIERAARDHDIDLKQSLLIGDKEADMQAAISAGVAKPLLLAKQPSLRYPTVLTLREVEALL